MHACSWTSRVKPRPLIGNHAQVPCSSHPNIVPSAHIYWVWGAQLLGILGVQYNGGRDTIVGAAGVSPDVRAPLQNVLVETVLAWEGAAGLVTQPHLPHSTMLCLHMDRNVDHLALLVRDNGLTRLAEEVTVNCCDSVVRVLRLEGVSAHTCMRNRNKLFGADIQKMHRTIQNCPSTIAPPRIAPLTHIDSGSGGCYCWGCRSAAMSVMIVYGHKDR